MHAQGTLPYDIPGATYLSLDAEKTIPFSCAKNSHQCTGSQNSELSSLKSVFISSLLFIKGRKHLQAKCGDYYSKGYMGFVVMERVPLATTTGAMSWAGVLRTTGPARQGRWVRLGLSDTLKLPSIGLGYVIQGLFMLSKVCLAFIGYLKTRLE